MCTHPLQLENFDVITTTTFSGKNFTADLYGDDKIDSSELDVEEFYALYASEDPYSNEF